MIRDAQIYFGMETPLRGRSGGHTGAASTIPNDEWYCRNAAEVAVGYGRIVRKSMMEFGRVGACVPDRVALPRAHPSLNPHA